MSKLSGAVLAWESARKEEDRACANESLDMKEWLQGLHAAKAAVKKAERRMLDAAREDDSEQLMDVLVATTRALSDREQAFRVAGNVYAANALRSVLRTAWATIRDAGLDRQ